MKLKHFILPLLASFASINAFAETVEIDGIYYNLVSKVKTAEVTSNPDKYYGAVNIPATVTYNGTNYNVTSIGESAFQRCYWLNSVEIPSSVTTIGNLAFWACESLTSVVIPNSVTSIGINAFKDCIGLNSITLPNNLTSIADYTFADCNSLTSITIPESVTTIERYSFARCRSLTFITIPNNLTYISDGVFCDCTSLTSVSIPNSVTSIGGDAFNNCSSLTSVTIPNSVTFIGGGAFGGCTGLTSITIGSGVTEIGQYAFGNCPDLTDVYCYAENVPAYRPYDNDISLFKDSYIEYATLHVPKNSIEAYRTAKHWCDFGTIVPIPIIINDATTALNFTSAESDNSVKYTHDFSGEWEALCLPFAVDYNAIKTDFDLAEIDGVVQNDQNNDGTPDITILSIMGFKGQTTTPNKPYLIRAKSTGIQTISFENVTVYPTEEASIDCSSTSTKYEFTGSYKSLSSTALKNRYIVQDGELVKGASKLSPCRWYMTATARNGAQLNLPNKIRIMPVEDVITGVSPLGETEEGTVIYNLAGQRLQKMQRGINIIGGKKVLR